MAAARRPSLMRAPTFLAPALIIAPALLMTSSGCAQPGGATSATSDGGSSGIRGTTTVDSGSPIVYTTPRPRRPLPARLRISPHGPAAAAADVIAESDREGRFRIPLRPGTYTIRSENLNGAPVPTAHPVNVTVHPGTWTSLTIEFDSGIR
jgi:hypothetical protein